MSQTFNLNLYRPPRVNKVPQVPAFYDIKKEPKPPMQNLNMHVEAKIT
jgi:hypothetical protein